MVNIEDVGMHLKDMIIWVHSQGFPKGHDIGQAINKKRGKGKGDKWLGYRSCLKPAWEPIVVAEFSFEGAYYQQALRDGVSGLNIDACRIASGGESRVQAYSGGGFHNTYGGEYVYTDKGRYPANVILEDSQEVLAGMPRNVRRLFFCPKASKQEKRLEGGERNRHPTVKPLKLMEYLIRMVTMPDKNKILDPYAGSGTTGVACKRLGIRAVLVEQEEEWCEVAARRLQGCQQLPKRRSSISR